MSPARWYTPPVWRCTIARKSSQPDIHLNLNVRGLEPSATVGINELCDALQADGKQVHRMGLGQSPFPVPGPVVEELRVHAHQKAYLAVRGLRQLREAVAAYHHRSQGMACSADEVLVGPGSKELMFLLQLVYYGDLVVPTPAWVSYAPQARIIGRQISWLPTDREVGWRMTADQLDALCAADSARPRLLILNYPNNPTGGTYPTEELKRIAQVARRHKVVILSDEIYGELHHRNQHVSIARFYPEGTIVSSGLSKWCGAGGWRLGTFVFPHSMRWLLEAMAATASETYTSTSAPIQYAAVRAFEGGLTIERYLWQSRRILSALGRWCHRRMIKTGLLVEKPLAAFYLFADCGPLAERMARAGVRTSAEMCARLLREAGVAVLPGSQFGRPPGELSLRLAYVDFDGARALAAAEQLPPEQPLGDDFLGIYCHNVLGGIEGICGWFDSLPA